MDRIDTLRAFLRVAATGSFSVAADQLGLPRPSVSLAIQQLEARLGVRLAGPLVLQASVSTLLPSSQLSPALSAPSPHVVTGVHSVHAAWPSQLSAGASTFRALSAIASDGITTVFGERLASPKMAQTLADDMGVSMKVLDPIEDLEAGP